MAESVRVTARRASIRPRAVLLASATLLSTGTLVAAGDFASAPVASAATAAVSCTATTCTQTFAETGSAATWTVPAGVTSASFDLYGAEGAQGSSGAPGGLGAEISGSLPVTSGETLQVNVGGAGDPGVSPGSGGGYNGGGDGSSFEGGTPSGGGGGATDIRSGALGLGDRLLVAGGGGGGGGEMIDVLPGGAGGDAGALGATGAPVAGYWYMFWYASAAEIGSPTGSPTSTSYVSGSGGGTEGGGSGTSSSGGGSGANASGASITGANVSTTEVGITGANSNPSSDPSTPTYTCATPGSTVNLGPGGSSGSLGSGGAGGPGGGGGGGGYYGGGGGSGSGLVGSCFGPGGGGGGGGSSYLGSATDTSGPTPAAAPDGAPNGEAIITYANPIGAGSPSYTAIAGETLSVGAPGLLGAATGPSGDTLAVVPVSGESTTAGGTVTINSDGSFSYTPPASLTTGTDSFSYAVSDGVDYATGTATIAVGTGSVLIDKQISTNDTIWQDVGAGVLNDPSVLAGSLVYERVIVTNTGSLAISDATVTDVSTTDGALPASFTFGGSSSISTLAAGQSVASDVADVTASAGHQIDMATVTGTAVASGGETATVTASDEADYTGDVAPTFILDSPALVATAGASYAYTFSAGGIPAPTYSLGSGAPSWLTIDSTTGALSGTVPPGTTSFSYEVIAGNSVSSVTAGPFNVAIVSPASVVFRGSLTYANNGNISSSSLTIRQSFGVITSVTGAVTIPGLNGGTATIALHVFRVFGIYIGVDFRTFLTRDDSPVADSDFSGCASDRRRRALRG
ncbi:MAG: Ig-like domain-containing protein [Acidimicrobiales bacterium]